MGVRSVCVCVFFACKRRFSIVGGFLALFRASK